MPIKESRPLAAALVVVCALALPFVSGCAAGKNIGPALDKKGIFEALDEDHDGRLSPDEYYRLYKSKNDSAGMFSQYDSNGDGYLDYNEFNIPGNAVIRW